MTDRNVQRPIHILRPKTISDIKSLAKKLKKQDGISHSWALEEAARHAGFVTYREALTQLREGVEMIVQLPGGSMVNTDHVVSISRDFYNRYLIVKTVLGDTFEVQPVYGQSIFDAETKLLAAMNADGKGGAA